MDQQWYRWLTVLEMMGAVLMLLACGAGGNVSGSTEGATVTAGPKGAATQATGPGPTLNTIHFNVTGEVAGSYTIASTELTSKLRHGHREFTIEVANKGRSFIMAFYGYDGPGAYSLEGVINGGDVRVDLGKDSLSTPFARSARSTAWDLPQKQGIACALHVTSDMPTQYTGTDRMTGDFSCPLLASTDPTLAQKNIAINDGHFDLFILVES